MMHRRSRPRDHRPTAGSDTGAAMVIALVWAAVISIVAAAVITAVFNQVRPSDRIDRSYQALAAAEAGIEDMRARLAADSNYWLDVRDGLATDNAGLTGWVEVPGGESSGEFTYWLDTSDAQRNGRLTVVSTGRSVFAGQEVTRTVEAQMVKRTAANYVYVSNTESFPWDAPGVYGLPGEESKDGLMSRDVAQALCGNDGVGGDRYWYQWSNWDYGDSTAPFGPATAQSSTDSTITGSGPHRNSQACLFGRIESTDTWVGDMHTNDVWYLDPTIANIDPLTDSGRSDQVFSGRISSACPGENPGSLANGTCRDDHRWIDANLFGSASNLGKDPTVYVNDEIPDNANQNGMLWNPIYESPLEMPSEAEIASVRALAEADGCVFTGPTRIQFTTTVTGSSIIHVTSPDTVTTNNAFCGGTSLLASDVNAHPTVTLDYSSMVAAGFNGAIYVGAASSSDWPGTSEETKPPSCRAKSSNSGRIIPFIIPDPSVDPVRITSTSPGGYPVATTGSIDNIGGKIKREDEWTAPAASRCWEGDLYIDAPAESGGYTGQFSVVAEGDIVFTDDVVESSVTDLNPDSETWGVPNPASTSQLGLVSGRWTYAYHLDVDAGGDKDVYQSVLKDLLLNIVLLAPDKCLTVQDFKSQPAMGTFRVVGSIGQDSRCRIVGDASGYQKLSIYYDERLRTLGPPPYLSGLSLEPWNMVRRLETVVRRDAVAKDETGLTPLSLTQAPGSQADYDVAGSLGELQYARIVSGSGDIEILDLAESQQLRFTAPNGVARTYIDAVIRASNGSLVGRQLVIDTTA